MSSTHGDLPIYRCPFGSHMPLYPHTIPIRNYHLLRKVTISDGSTCFSPCFSFIFGNFSAILHDMRRQHRAGASDDLQYWLYIGYTMVQWYTPQMAIRIGKMMIHLGLSSAVCFFWLERKVYN